MIEVLSAQMRTAGGPVLLALLAVSVAALTVTIVKIVQFSRMGVGHSRGARAAVALWNAGEWAAALDQAEQEVSPSAAAVAAAMRSLAERPADRSRAREVAVQVATDQLASMSRHLRILEAVVQAAPMMGLLGTVIGMISAFGALSRGGGAVDPALLATGIWAALLTTAAGLAVAIPFYFVFVWLDARVEEERTALDARIGALLAGEINHDGSEGAGVLAVARYASG